MGIKTIIVDESVHKRLRAAAKRERRNIGEVAEMAIAAYCLPKKSLTVETQPKKLWREEGGEAKA